MKHRTLCVALCLAAGCTYNTYKTYNEAPSVVGEDDAGVHEVVLGTAGTSAAGAGGSGGSVVLEEAGSPLPDADCTGCVRLGVLSSRFADYQRQFGSPRDLATSLVRWRVRVRDYVGDVQLTAYVQSGDQPDEEFTSAVTLNVAAGWQDIGIDLQPIPAFRPKVFIDAGGSAGGGFDYGYPFDKTRVQRVGLRVAPSAQPGVFTPAILELDAVTFTSQQDLNVDFSSGPGGFELVDPDSGTATFVAE